ncbi:dihydrofolate reductase family protein [Patescibacteria group bacterium]|nr:dihydrofolate reductase family protein [Patescibacteria group bacterium]
MVIVEGTTVGHKNQYNRYVTRKPHYIAIAAVTLDGKIGANEKHFSNWTSKEDKKFMRALLDTCDVIIVGNNTYKTALKPLSKRNCIVLTRSIKTTKKVSEKLLYLNTRSANLKKTIQKTGYKKIAVLGGAQTYSYCLEHGMLDDLYLTIEPVIFGSGVPLFAGKFKLRKTKILSVKKLNKTGTLLVHSVFRQT